ncbi:MAG: tripartite tricarboxylate transporter substrate binding protein [Proteobacteria bacterium]|nr:tripartite tricarboxylate transporter substrate binding protein [Pseudomonadota bacterium]
MNKTLLIAATIAALCGPLPGRAEDAYPSKPVSVVVPFSPGGISDVIGRPFVHSLGKALKQSFIIENRPGAGGGVGMAYAARAKPDGYTVMVALSSISAIPASDRLFGRPPSYEINQFAPIALISADPAFLVVRADSPWKTVKDLVDAAKAKPGGVPYGSTGNYGTMHVGMEMFANAAGIKMNHIPYGGGGQQVAAIVGKQVDAITQLPATIAGHVAGGRLRPLATFAPARVAGYPDVPTMKELGYPEVEYFVWTGFFAPAGTPPNVLSTLRRGAREAMQDAEFRNAMEKLRAPVVYKDADEFQAYLDADAKRLTAVIQKIGKVE